MTKREDHKFSDEDQIFGDTARIPSEGAFNSMFMPFNTFPSDSVIQMRAKLTMSDGSVVFTDAVTFDTPEGEAKSTIQPIPTDTNQNVSPEQYLREGITYIFDQSHPSNSGHPLRFSRDLDGTHTGGNPFNTNVTIVGTAGTEGAYTKITVPHGLSDDLYYYCVHHPGMGNKLNIIPDSVPIRYDVPNEPDTADFSVLAPNATISARSEEHTSELQSRL